MRHGIYMFVNLENEMVMDMFGHHPVANWPSGSRTQEWEIRPLGHGYTIRNVATDTYLSVVEIENTAPLWGTHFPVAWYFRRIHIQEGGDPCYEICWPHTPYKFELALEDAAAEERRRRAMDFDALTLYKQRCRRWKIILRATFREEPMTRRRREASTRDREAARERRPAGAPVMRTAAPTRPEAETPVYVVAPSSTTEPDEPTAPADAATRTAHPSVTELEYGSLGRGTAVPTEQHGVSPSVTAYTPTIGPSGTETEGQSSRRRPTLGRRLRRFLGA
ncbi:hypothetical protein EDC04DRAFT_360416 [Pisolithus marmoratus]|nr:hypothetical protein EDC04DRAFT_360416 [Pisolithus marmoratus]